MGPGIHILAASDGVTIGLAVLGLLQFAFGIFVSVNLSRLAAGQKRFDTIEDRLTKTAAELVNERFAAAERQYTQQLSSVTANLATLNNWLEETDHGIDDLASGDHALELKLLAGMAQIREFVMERAATREDLLQHRKEAEERSRRQQEHMSQQDREISEIKAGMTRPKTGGR